MATPQTDIAPNNLPLDQVVAHWGAVYPDRTVLSYYDGSSPREVRWGEFNVMIVNMAARLSAHVHAGDSVAVLCANGVAFHVLVNALWRLGAGVLLLDRHWGPAIVEDLLALVHCHTLFSETGGAAYAGSAMKLRAFPSLDTAPPPELTLLAPQPGSMDRVALYATTSGTTDNPKCVAITHRQLRAAYHTCLNIHDFSVVRRGACLFELNSLGVLGVCFLLPREVGGGTKVFPSFSIANVAATWRGVLDDAIDFVYLVPPLVRLINTLPARDVTQRRLLAFCASAPVTEQELQKLEEKFPLRIFNCYGLTELTFAVFFGCRNEDGTASESIGLPQGIQARLVDEDGAPISGKGQGELLLNGPMLTDGYLHNLSATQATWDQGWLKTGDVAECDAQGRYFIRGRKKDAVLRGSYIYYLHELEHYLRRVPSVIDACAFKGRDLPSGDELCVVVQASAPLAPATLLQWIRVNMGSNKVPNVLYVWQRGLPRNSNGKVLRQELARMHADNSIYTGA